MSKEPLSPGRSVRPYLGPLACVNLRPARFYCRCGKDGGLLWRCCVERSSSVSSSGNYSGPLSSEQLQHPSSHGFSEQVLKGRSSKTCLSKSKVSIDFKNCRLEKCRTVVFGLVYTWLCLCFFRCAGTLLPLRLPSLDGSPGSFVRYLVSNLWSNRVFYLWFANI